MVTNASHRTDIFTESAFLDTALSKGVVRTFVLTLVALVARLTPLARAVDGVTGGVAVSTLARAVVTPRASTAVGLAEEAGEASLAALGARAVQDGAAVLETRSTLLGTVWSEVLPFLAGCFTSMTGPACLTATRPCLWIARPQTVWGAWILAVEAEGVVFALFFALGPLVSLVTATGTLSINSVAMAAARVATTKTAFLTAVNAEGVQITIIVAPIASKACIASFGAITTDSFANVL